MKKFLKKTEIAKMKSKEIAPLLDVYVAKISPNYSEKILCCELRNQEIKNTRDETLKLQKYWAWRLLEYAVKNSLNLDPENVNFQKQQSGEWTADDFYFSISHSDEMICVAVSNEAVGVDIESVKHFFKSVNSMEKQVALKKRISHQNETESYFSNFANDENNQANLLLELWLKKESAFKFCKNEIFFPKDIDTTKFNYIIKNTDEYSFAVCSEISSVVKIFVIDDIKKY